MLKVHLQHFFDKRLFLEWYGDKSSKHASHLPKNSLKVYLPTMSLKFGVVTILLAPLLAMLPESDKKVYAWDKLSDCESNWIKYIYQQMSPTGANLKLSTKSWSITKQVQANFDWSFVLVESKEIHKMKISRLGRRLRSKKKEICIVC